MEHGKATWAGLALCLVTGIGGGGAIGAAFAQAPSSGPVRLVADINQEPTQEAGSYAMGFVRLGAITIFAATSHETGWALWRTDGTTAGTWLVKDVAPVLAGAGSLVVFNGAVYFAADDGIHGKELWRTDGTEAGTLLVKDIVPGPDGALLFGRFVVFRGALFFKANDHVHGLELWKSDGTESGTVLVKDTDPATTSYGGLSSSEIILTEAGGALFFTSLDYVHGSELWKTDGTEEGTVLVKDIAPGTHSSVPANFFDPVALNGVLYFEAWDGNHQGLWKSDGTEAGTVLVKEATGGNGLIYELAVASGKVFFVADDAASGQDVWATDGTPEGTVLVRDLHPPYYGQWPHELTAVGGIMYFLATDDGLNLGLWRSDGTEVGATLVELVSAEWLTSCGGVLYFGNFDSHGIELWRSDGTEAGTALVKDIRPGGLSSLNYQSYTSPFSDVDGILYFSAEDGVHGVELWKSDGTDSGTALVADINAFPQTRSSSPAALVEMGGNLYFSATDNVAGRELWKTDGTSAGTSRVKDIPGGGLGGEVTAIGETLYFVGSDNDHGIELWKSDGTDAGTVLLEDINTQPYAEEGYPGDSRPLFLTELNGILYFSADDGIHGRELWRSDGTESGTVMVKDIDPADTFQSMVGWFTILDGALIFAADDGIHGSELWRSDGTEAGTFLLRDIRPGSSSSFNTLSKILTKNGDSAFFTADDGTHGTELWKTDGTEAGTVLVADLCPGSCSASSTGSLVVGGILYFGRAVGVGGVSHNELWKSDGTPEGTVFIKSFYPTASRPYSVLTRFVDVEGTLFFHADDGVHGVEPWKTDGTEEGTVLVRDIHAGNADSADNGNRTQPAVIDGVYYFTADDGDHGIELWRSDGTEEGTRLVQDIHPGPDGSQPTQITEIEGTMLFRADDGVHGIEVWKSDGTAEGTALVQDIAPGSPGSGSYFMTDPILVGNRILFSADDGLHGTELWSARAAVLAGNPRLAIQDLGAELDGLDLPEGLGRVIRRTLDQATAALDGTGDRAGAAAALCRFVQKVQVLSHRMISDEERASLIEFAEEILAMLAGESDGEGGRGGRGQDRGGRRWSAPTNGPFPGAAGPD